MDQNQKKHLLRIQAPDFFLAALGFAFIDIARKAYHYSVVDSSILGPASLTLHFGSFTMQLSQLLTVVGLTIVALLLVRGQGRSRFFHPVVLVVLAAIMTVSYLTKLNGVGDASAPLQLLWECTKLCGCLITLAWVKELYDYEGLNTLVVFAVALVFSAAAEMLFAFLNAQSVLALCLATPLFSVILMFLYRHMSKGNLPMWTGGAYARSIRHSEESEDAAASQSMLTRRDIILLFVLALCYGIIRSLEHGSIDIARDMQSGLIIKQLFDASGTLLAGILIILLLPSDLKRTNPTFYKVCTLVGFIVAAFIYLSAQNVTAASLLTTFADAAYRFSLFVMLLIPLISNTKWAPLSLYAPLFAINQAGVLLGSLSGNHSIMEFLMLIASFTVLVVDVVLDLVTHQQEGSSAASGDAAETTENNASADSKETPSIDDENSRLLFWVYLSNVYHLTEREFEILQLLLKDYDIKSIAQELIVSYETAKSHRRNVLQKLGAKDNAELQERVAQLEREDYPRFLRTLLEKAEL